MEVIKFSDFMKPKMESSLAPVTFFEQDDYDMIHNVYWMMGGISAVVIFSLIMEKRLLKAQDEKSAAEMILYLKIIIIATLIASGIYFLPKIFLPFLDL
jgi:hypothetical protein